MIFVGISNFKNGTEKCQRTVPRFEFRVNICFESSKLFAKLKSFSQNLNHFRKFETTVFAKLKSFSKIPH